MAVKQNMPDKEELDTEEMKKHQFLFTTKAYATAGGYAVTLPGKWGFKSGDMILLKVRDFHGNAVTDYKRVCRQSSKRGSTAFFLNRSWGFNPENFLTIGVTLVRGAEEEDVAEDIAAGEVGL